MDTLIYFLARALIAFIQALPLIWVARLGRALGAIAFRLDARHRNVALENLTMCFEKEKSPKEIRAIAKENFRRIGENFDRDGYKLAQDVLTRKFSDLTDGIVGPKE